MQEPGGGNMVVGPTARFLRDFSLIPTAISCDPTGSLAGMGWRHVPWRRPRSLGPLRLSGGPPPPDPIERHDDKPDQRPTATPLVPHLLQEAKQPVGTLHVIVGPYPPAGRVVQVGHQLGELLRVQLVQRLDQLGHGPERRVTHDYGPATTRLVIVLGRVEEPVVLLR